MGLTMAHRPRGAITKKWLGFVTAIWVQAIAGNNYTFANYSVALKAILGLNQVQLNNLSVAKDVGKAFGLVAGFASDYLPAWVILLIGSVEGFVGYGAQWLVVSQRIRPLPYWQMCVFLCMGGNSTTWMNTAVLVTCMRNFSKNRGPVVGILKGYIGLSTAIFTDICSALFASNPSSFLLMLSVVPGLVCFTAMVFMRPVPSAVDEGEEKEEVNSFYVLNILAVVTAVYLLTFDMTGEHGIVLSRAFVGFLLLLLAAPLIVPAKLLIQRRFSAHPSSNPRTSSEKQITEPLLDTAEEGAADSVSVVTESPPPPPPPPPPPSLNQIARKPLIGEDHTIFQAMQKFDFWLLFLAFLCGVGTGMAVINNMGQIGLAMGYVDVSVFVSLISIWGFFGRIGAGSISEHFLRKAGIPRPVWMAVSQVVMIVGYITMAIGMQGSLYIGSMVVGICYGVRLSISVPTASELFGLKYYGLIYNFLILNLPLGSFLFSGLLAGILYDIEAAKDRKENVISPLLTRGWSSVNFNGLLSGRHELYVENGKTCVGAHCYRLVFLVMAGVCLLGLGLDLLLTFRTKKLYSNLYRSRKARVSQHLRQKL
ncbi:protein NUCLEAR FUSION DEFECTIVE 4 [Cryptomeria japonica]|uniref:protein NUCLEAR FUSION DEFECTIVE 4 n=1 Tax=Cryptomeria japonica TaxID=3369 RepID=UPI0027DA8CAD|nr:protein NUCLEAR FUSION DEFECTIVE 4 [Cryptomeria japonica]